MGRTPNIIVTGSVLDVLRKEHPEVQKAIEQQDIWDYTVFGPMSLDDRMEVSVRIRYGKVGVRETKEYVLEWK